MKKLIAFSIFVGGAVAANANTALFSTDGLVAGQNGAVTINYKGQSEQVLAGPVHAQLNNGSFFSAYCVDLNDWNNAKDSYDVNIRSMNEKANGGQAAYLYDVFAGAVDTKNKGEALQLAIWDVISDGGDGLNNGQFKANVSSSVLNLANNYIQASKGKSGSASWLQAVDHGKNAGGHGINQDMMGPTECVPEPSAMIALSIGILGLVRRRQARKA